MRTRQERLHRLITGRASLPERWTTGRRNTQTRSSSSWLRAMASWLRVGELQAPCAPCRASYACMLVLLRRRARQWPPCSKPRPSPHAPPILARPESFGVRTATSSRQRLEQRPGWGPSSLWPRSQHRGDVSDRRRGASDADSTQPSPSADGCFTKDRCRPFAASARLRLNGITSS